MEWKSPPPCPNTVTVRRNPPRKARPTPSTAIPFPILPSSSSSIPQKDIPSFPLQEILSIELPQNPNSDLSTSEPSKIFTPISENLKVFLRIRPLNPQNGAQTIKMRAKNAWPQNPTTKNTSKAKTTKKKSEICVAVDDDSHSVTICPPQALQDSKRIKSEVYEGFTHVFDSDSSQDEVFGKMVNPLVEDFIRGKSGMFAALGPSGSGKTHTVFGSPREPGMVPLALRQIFLQCEGSGTQLSRSFYLSMFEIYTERGKGEKMFDLFQDGGDLFMQQSSIKGLQEVMVSDVQEAESLIARGILKRATATTNSNNQSSRSQCIINFRSAPNKINGVVDIQSNSAVLTIVDLAGAEREKRTGNQGARLRESNFINNTSMVLGLCLRSLLEHQKNPKKKPLEKHFQNSLLTRYLRDYLEGRKRMTLILTIKPGEEDYLDTSYLLRQASPFMKIKFNNAAEAFNSNHNKRQFQTSRTEQLKRMKFSSLETSTINEGRGSGDEGQLQKEEVAPDHVKMVKTLKVSGNFQKASSLETDKDALLEEDCTELANRERQSQIMQGFAKALWTVLKQYKDKLQVAESEIQRLSESLTNEKSHSSELQNKLKNLKSCCSCGLRTEAKASVVEVDEHETKAGVAPLVLKESGCVDIEQKSSVTIGSPCVGFLSCLDVENSEEQSYQDKINKSLHHCTLQKHECFGENVDNAEDIKDSEDAGRVDNHITGATADAEHSESFACSSESHAILRDDSCFSVDRYLQQNEEDMMKCSGVVTVSCHGTEKFHLQCPQGIGDNTKDLKDSEDIKRVNAHLTGEEADSGLSASVVSSSQSPIRNGDESYSSVEVDQLQNAGDQKLLDQATVHADDAKRALGSDISKTLPNDKKLARGCDISDLKETESKQISCKNASSAKKPKRRLLPASSILLKDTSGLGFEDENQKLKENRGEKKLAADESKRTRGSITLLRLLTNNLK